MSGLGFGVAIAAVVVVGVIAYVVGRRRPLYGGGAAPTIDKRLEEYAFYPFTVDATGHVAFAPETFNAAVTHLLDERNTGAARELIIIGEQNLIRDTFPSDWLENYKQLYDRYDGDGIVSDNDLFLENYVRIAHQIGRSFPNAGIEVFLHNLVNPSRSLVAIENGEVTGRKIGSGATDLVLDLKTRRQRGEDKVNYQLNLGSRQFKCTTVPIFRPEYGLVGALCINIDAHFIRDAAATGGDRLEALVDNLLRTNFVLEENILSKDEYRKPSGESAITSTSRFARVQTEVRSANWRQFCSRTLLDSPHSWAMTRLRRYRSLRRTSPFTDRPSDATREVF